MSLTAPRARHFAFLPLLAAIACREEVPPTPSSVPVTVAPVERRAVPFELMAPGTVEPLRTVAVRAQVNGQLMRVAFREGQEVEPGQVLFQIDPRPFRAALAQAEAARDRARAEAANAEREAERLAALVEQDYVTKQQHEEARTRAEVARAGVAAAEAAVEQARLNLEYATIRAPIAGRTGSLAVREGNLVRAADATPLVTINQLRPILVRFAVPAANLPLIQRHRDRRMPVLVEPVGSDGPGATQEGTLTFIDNAVDTATGTILLKATFPNRDGSLWPGGFVNVRLRLFVEEDALVVPAAAVVEGQQGGFVFLVGSDSSAVTRPVRVDRTAGELAVVQGELEPGQLVVVDGQLRLRQGSKVQIRTAGDSARAEAR
ncbi:MAG TPA: efflux RND transporter periplasmic adaptor subunit [Gemmatimonadales bacterium]|nr:efflux RND transporter periplasmic adaptor subunit [Gemmatimonadales bacterium]